MQVLKSETLSREELKLSPDKPTILLVTDSPCIHTGLANAVRRIWEPIYKTGEFNIVQLGWWHRDPVEKSLWPLVITNRNTPGQLDPQDHYGNVSLTKVLPKIKPDLIWLHGDPWMMIPVIARRPVIQCPIIAYLSVDGGPLDRDPFQRPPGVDPGRTLPQQLGWHEAANTVDIVVPYLKWGQDMIKNAFPGANVVDPIPLGVDTDVFRPMSAKDVGLTKERLLKIPGNSKVFISVSRNQLRKFLPYNFQALHFLREGRYSVCECGAYNLWLRNYSFAADIGPVPVCKYCGSKRLKPGTPRQDLYYYMHTAIDELMEDSWRLPPLMKHMGLMNAEESECVFTNLKLKSVHGVPEKELASYYAMCDAFALPSNEGFGLPFMEALSCGLPIVAPNYSAHVDYLEGIADLVDCPTMFCEPGTNYWRGLPDPDQWAQAIDEATYMSEAEREMAQARNRKVALEYDWRTIWPRWVKLLREAMASKKESRMWSQIIRGV